MAKAKAEAQVHLSLVDRLSRPLRRIKARLASFGNRLGFDRISRATAGLTRSIGNLGGAIGRTSGRLGAFAGLLGVGAGGAAWAAFNLAKRTADVGDEVGKLARQIGFGVEALQEWRYVAELSGVAQSEMNVSLEAFNRRIGEAAAGNKAMMKHFKGLGVSVTDAAGKIRSTDEIFEEVMVRLSQIEDPAKKAAFAMGLFGRSGMRMVRIADNDAEAMKRLREEARRLGFVLGEDVTRKSEAFNDNLTRLSRRFEGLKLVIGASLLPTMDDLVVRLNEWYEANAKLIRSKVVEWAKALADVINKLLDPTSDIRRRIAEWGEAVSSLLERIQPIVSFLGGPFQATLALIAVWIAGPMITAITALSFALVKLGAVILTTPFGWILAAVAAVGASVYVLIQRWDEFKSYWSGLWARISSAFDQGFVQGVLAVLKEFNPLVHIVRGLDAVVEYFTGISLLDEGADFAASFIEGLGNFGASVVNFFVDGFNEVVAFFGGLASRFWDMGSAIVDSLLDGIKAKWVSLKSWFASSMANMLPDWTPDWIKNKLGFGNATVAAPGGAPKPPNISAPAGASPAFAPISYNAPSAVPREMMANEVEAGTVRAENFQMPEPLLVREPQQIDASTHIGQLVVQGGNGTPGEIRAAVASELAAHSRRQEAATRAALND